MKLLIILLCLGLERFLPVGAFLYRFSWFNWYVGKLHKWLGATMAWRGYSAIALVALPILILVSVIYYGSYFWLHGWLKFLVATLVLLYCLGPESFYRQKDSISQDIFEQANQHLLAVLFWFALLGPLAAVLYRVVALLAKPQQDSLVYANMSQTANTALSILDWLPIRFFSLIFALVGNFVKTFNCWLDQVITGWSKNRELLNKCGRVAQGLEENAQLAEANLSATLSLIDRTLIVFVVIVAAFTLGAWL